MKKIFFVFCLIPAIVLIAYSQNYKIAEPYGTTETSGKLPLKSNQKYTYLYDTSLIQAIKLQDEHRVKLLMYAQVNPNEKNDEGFTPLYFAAQYLTPETLAMIIDKGAKVNLPSTYNLTPLMAAAAAGRADNVEVLIEYGADPNMLDDKELTALDHAYNNRQLEAAILLNPITTVKKSTMNYDAWIEESLMPVAKKQDLEKDIYAGETVINVSLEDEEVYPEVNSELKAEVEAPKYNATLDEIDAKIEKTRQALARLINLRKQIALAEEPAVNQSLQEDNSAATVKRKTVKPSAKPVATRTTSYTKTTTSKTTTTTRTNN